MDNVNIVLPTTKQGVTASVSLEGDSIITKHSFDMEPLLKEAEQARIATSGLGWGDGRVVGTIPLYMASVFMQIKDKDERKKRIFDYLKENSSLIKFDPFRKTLFGHKH